MIACIKSVLFLKGEGMFFSDATPLCLMIMFAYCQPISAMMMAALREVLADEEYLSKRLITENGLRYKIRVNS